MDVPQAFEEIAVSNYPKKCFLCSDDSRRKTCIFCAAVDNEKRLSTIQKSHRCKQRATALFFLYFSAVFGDFLSILIPFLTSCDPRPPMCSTPVCGILCGQKQCLAGVIPAGLCRILRIPLFSSMNNMKTAPRPPHEVGCHNQRKQPARREIFREERSWRKDGCGV